MIIGGLISILIAIWIYRTALEEKTSNAIYWVFGSFVVYITIQILMIYFNVLIIETFDSDVNADYAEAGGREARDRSGTGIQDGPGGTLIGILFEIIPFIVPFFVVAVIRLKLMLKQPVSFKTLFGGIKETFTAIIKSFKDVK